MNLQACPVPALLAQHYLCKALYLCISNEPNAIAFYPPLNFPKLTFVTFLCFFSLRFWNFFPE